MTAPPNQLDLLAWTTPEPTPQSNPAVSSQPRSQHTAGYPAVRAIDPALRGLNELGLYPPRNPPTPSCDQIAGWGKGENKPQWPTQTATPQSAEPAGAGDCGVRLRGAHDHSPATAQPQPNASRVVPPAPELRPYQLEALTAIEREFARGIRTTLVVLPTGTGKTVLFAEYGRRAVARARRVLVLAHREELLDQARRKFTDVGVFAAIEQGSQRAGMAPVVIASVATMHAKRLATFSASAFDDIIVDEGHHAPAQSYRNILDKFPHAKVLLVTATPDRADGKALGKICESVAYRLELRQAIADGWLAPLVAHRVLVEGVDLSGVSVRAGDFAADELSAIFGEAKALQGVAVPLLRLAGQRRTIAFAVDVANAHALAELLNTYEPGVARAVDGSASREDRKATLAAFRRGDFRILVNCALFTEGFDEPSVSCVAIARPTKSRALHCQMLGRGTRLFAGKTDCLVIDFVGNTGKHSLVGPADALASNDVDAELRAEIERLLGEESSSERDLEVVMRDAEQQLAQKKLDAKFAAVVDYRTKQVDPFVASFLRGSPVLQGEMATQPQIARLANFGLEKVPAALTKHEASRWISALVARAEAGLPSLKLTRMLDKAYVNTAGMTNERAKALSQKLIANSYSSSSLRKEPEFDHVRYAARDSK